MTTTNNFHRFPADKREHLNNLLAWAAEDAERGEIHSAERYTREWLRVYQHCEDRLFDEAARKARDAFRKVEVVMPLDSLPGGVSAGDY